MTRPVRDFAGQVVGVALVVRLATIMVALAGMVGQTMTGPLLSCILLLTATTFAMLMYRTILDFVVEHPITLVADVLLNLAVVTLLGVESPLVLATFPAALIIGVLTRSGVAVAGAVVLVAGYLLAYALSPVPAGGGFMTDLGVPALYCAFVAIGATVRFVYDRQMAVTAALAEAQRSAAAADERARLAREMHDSLGKTLHGLALGAQGLVEWVERDPAMARMQAAALAEGAEQAAREARALLVRMRQDEPDRALVEVLADICAKWQEHTGIRCRFSAHEAVDLPTGVRYDALAVVSEALENVVRHADAGLVRVTLDRDDSGGVVLSVSDDGVGFEVARDGHSPRGHFGLTGMHERAAEVGGTVRVESAPGAGTRVVLEWAPDAGSGTERRPWVGAGEGRAT